MRKTRGAAAPWRRRALGTMFASLASLVFAQFAFAESLADEDMAFGGGRLTSSVQLTGTYTDNFYNACGLGSACGAAASKKERVYGALAHPTLSYLLATGSQTLRGTVDGEYGTFSAPGNADDYLDRAARGLYGWTATARNRVELTADYQHGHDPFGINRTENTAVHDVALDQWELADAGARYRYGAPTATLNAELGFTALSKRYTTNTTNAGTPPAFFGKGTQFLDYRSTAVDYALFYNLSPKTAMLVDFARTQVNIPYQFPGGDNRSGVEYKIRTGARWQATAKTSGDVRVGVRRRLDDQGTVALQGLDWQAGVDWSPRTVAVFRLKTGRSEQESYVASATLIDVQWASLEWVQTWTGRIKSQLGTDYNRSRFVGAGRSDSNYGGNFGVEYRGLSWLSLLASTNYADRESTSSGRHYNRLNGYLGIRLGY